MAFLVMMFVLCTVCTPADEMPLDCDGPGESLCSSACNIQPNSSLYPGFKIYRKKSCPGSIYEEVNNGSTLCSFGEDEFLCNRALIWCISNASIGTVMWELSDSSSSEGAMELCLCTYNQDGDGNSDIDSCSSNKEGTYQCIHSDTYDYSKSTTLEFTHSSHIEMCQTQDSAPSSCIITSTVSMPKDCLTISSKEYSTVSFMSSPDLSFTLTLSSTYASLLSTSSAFLTPVSSIISPVQSSSTVPHYTGIGLLVATNLLTIIALISSCVYIFCQRKKSKFIITENEQIPLQNTSPQTEATSHNTETSPTSNNNTSITSATNIYSSVEDEVDHYHHCPPARVASQYEVPLDLLQQAHIPLPPPPPLYATLDDQHDLTLPNPECITNTAVTAPNPGYTTNITPKANPGYSSIAIKEEGEGGERAGGERREELDYSYATVNKFLKKPIEDTEYNALQHE